MLHPSIRFLVGRQEERVKWLDIFIKQIYQADLSGAAATAACCGVPLIWCLTSSQSGCVSANKYIHYFSLPAYKQYQYWELSVLRALSEKEEGERQRKKWQISSIEENCCVLQKCREKCPRPLHCKLKGDMRNKRWMSENGRFWRR